MRVAPKRRAQPQGPASIDLRNPVAQGVCDWFLPTHHNLTGPGAGSTVQTADGLAFSNTTGPLYRDSAPKLSRFDGVTLLVVVNTNSALFSAGSGTYIVGYGNSSSTAMQLGIRSASGFGQIYWRDASGFELTPQFTTSSERFNDGRTHVLIARMRNGVASLFHDGRKMGEAAPLNWVSDWNANRFAVGALPRTTLGSQEATPVLMSATWQRGLDDAEILSLSENPWQVFAPVPRRIYVNIGAIGASIDAGLNDVLAANDALAAASSYQAALSDAAPASDAGSSLKSTSGALGESGAAADIHAAISVVQGATAEAAASSDLVSVGAAASSAALVDAATASDGGVASASMQAARVEPNAAADLPSAGAAASAAAGEPNSASDQANVGAAASTAAFADGASAADVGSALTSALATRGEPAAAADQPAAVAGVVGNVADAAVATDVTSTGAASTSAVVLEVGTAGDLVSQGGAATSAVVAEAAGAVDVLAALTQFGGQVAEAGLALEVPASVSVRVATVLEAAIAAALESAVVDLPPGAITALPMLMAARRAGIGGVRRLANAELRVGSMALKVVHIRASAAVAGFPASTGDREVVVVTDDLSALGLQRGANAILKMHSSAEEVRVTYRHDEPLTGTTRLTLELA